MNEMLGHKMEDDGGTLIRFRTNSAFMDEGGKQAGFTRDIVFSDGFPEEDQLSDEDVLKEFERLFTKFLLPWFERNSTLAGIRNSFRSAPNKTQTWENTLYTAYDSDALGGLFLMYYIDFMAGRLLNDDARTAAELYHDEYERAYITEYSKIDEDEGIPYIQEESIKKHFDILPTMQSRLDAVTPEQWAEYREWLGIVI